MRIGFDGAKSSSLGKNSLGIDVQKIYCAPRAKYVWQFGLLNLTYFEIPKTGSSSTKTVLFRMNYGLQSDQELNIGGGQLARNFPDSLAQSFNASDFLDRILVIYRDPVARAKSAYRSIFLGRQKMRGSLSEYFDRYFHEFIASDASDGLLNHHKPMSWFFPTELLNDPRSVFIETSALINLPNLLGLDFSTNPTAPSEMPHLLNVNKETGEIDMTDKEIRAALGPKFDDDFKLFENLKPI